MLRVEPLLAPSPRNLLLLNLYGDLDSMLEIYNLHFENLFAYIFFLQIAFFPLLFSAEWIKISKLIYSSEEWPIFPLIDNFNFLTSIEL